jgi:tRNA pseudouridine13 synthase
MRPIWPYLTADIAPIPAAIRRRDEDFQVEEVPLYDPCGSGDHVYAQIEKVGLSTRRAVGEIARALGLTRNRIGVAGHKDARGLTRQIISLEGIDPSRVKGLQLPGIRVLDLARHRTKLRQGSLRANRFVIKLREVPPGRIGDIGSVLDVLARRGVPNYFGPQRFGLRGDTWEVGRALLQGEYGRAAALTLGPVAPPDPEAARRAIFALDRSLLGFYVSAYQAWLFNAVLGDRLPALDRVLPGDIAYEYISGRLFLVQAVAAEQARTAAFAISPTGPIVGHTMPEPQGEPAVVERRVMEAAGVTVANLPRTGPLKCVGARRPLRFRPDETRLEPAADGWGPYLEVCFVLPPGCYATAVLRELCKTELQEERTGEDPT